MHNFGDRLAILGGAPLTNASCPKWPVIKDEDVAAIAHHLKHEDLSAYEVVDGPLFEFERELTDFFDCEHALLVSSGTAALQSALFALDIKQDDEVVVPAISYQGTGSVALHCGATVRLCDVDPKTGNPTLENLMAAITADTRAVMIGHAWGLPADLRTIQPFLAERGIKMIEDSARALGSRYQGKAVGTFGEAGCFSFHELKAVPAGEGGLLLTSDREVYERAVALGHYFRAKDPVHISLEHLKKYRGSSLGLNLKIHPLAACLARSQMKRLPDRLSDIAANYEQFALGVADCDGFELQPTPVEANCVSRYGFNVVLAGSHELGTPTVMTLLKAIRAEGVKVSTIGGAPLFQLPLYRDRGHPSIGGRIAGRLDDENFPGAIAHARTVLRFPTLFYRDEGWVDRYIGVLKKIRRGFDALKDWEHRVETDPVS